jgi:transposase InsO family protein
MIEQYEGRLSVKGRCEFLGVSPSGYYAWRKREPSQRQREDVQLGLQIEQVFEDSRRTYGSYRIYQALRKVGTRTSQKRVARLMRQRGLRSIRARKRRYGLTKAAGNAYVVPNLLSQNFMASRINEKWAADTTYIPTREGWLYLVSVLDLYSRRIVGWAMGEQHDAELASSALDMAIQRQGPRPGLILHSDRGTEFANACFQDRAHQARIRLSMSGNGNCYDNAVAESFFATLKLETVQGLVFASKQHAKLELFDYIEVFYNRQRLHSTLGFECPVHYAA